MRKPGGRGHPSTVRTGTELRGANSQPALGAGESAGETPPFVVLATESVGQRVPHTGSSLGHSIAKSALGCALGGDHDQTIQQEPPRPPPAASSHDTGDVSAVADAASRRDVPRLAPASTVAGDGCLSRTGGGPDRTNGSSGRTR
jgi:hypothetical protein